MARIILKTSLANRNVSIPWVQVEVVAGRTPDPVELIITPIKPNELNVEDVRHGLLPKEIKSIAFSSASGGRVVAKVSFNLFNYKEPLVSVNVPISANTRLISNSFTLTESMSTDSNVLIEEGAALQTRSTSKAGNTYTVNGVPGQSVMVFNKTFSVPDNYYFPSPPSYNIIGNKSNYKVTTVETSNAKNQIISKTFTINYTFPSTRLNRVVSDSISFSAASKQAVTLLKDKPVTSKKDGKIYSINVSKKLGLAGGIKTISVKGIPGTHFKILAQNGDKVAYNFKTGGVANGGVVEGVIPAARRGVGYGEFLKSIKIPASSTADSFDVRLSTDAPIDHEKLAKYLVDKTQPREGIFETTEVVSINPTLTIALKDGGPVDTSENPDGHPGIFKIFRPVLVNETLAATPTRKNGIDYTANGTHSIGKGVYGKSIGTFISQNPIISVSTGDLTGYSFLIEADGDRNFIQINRKPKFAKSGYARWDFATYVGLSGSYTKEAQVDGTEILSDFGTSIRHTVTSDTSDGTDIDFTTNDWNIKDVKVSLQGFGEAGDSAGPEDTLMYSYVILTITDINGSFGKADLIMDLNLKNFLSTITI